MEYTSFSVVRFADLLTNEPHPPALKRWAIFIQSAPRTAKKYFCSKAGQLITFALFIFSLAPLAPAQRHSTADGKLRIALVKQPFSPTGTSVGPNTMANGGIQQILATMNTDLRVEEVSLTATELTEYGAWKKLGWALGHFSDIVAKNERVCGHGVLRSRMAKSRQHFVPAKSTC